MTIQQFINKWFKNGVHREGVLMYFNVYGENSKSLGRYVEKNFGSESHNNSFMFQNMSVDQMDQYMEDLFTIL